MTTPARKIAAQAACLTAPAPGGIAVVRVVGADLPTRLNDLLRSRKPLDWNGLFAGELRLCEIVDEQDVIDEGVVAARRLDDGRAVVDLNTHGGPRVVQRVLMLLRDRGVQIVEPSHLEKWTAETGRIQRDVDAALLGARTRPLALWLAHLRVQLPAVLRDVCQLIERGECATAVGKIERLLADASKAQLAVRGVKVVLSGRANVGKSTLANALAGEERALVSDQAGTTRDWVEHPTAIEGLPFTLIDTAGIRGTSDPLEQEAIRRTHLQRRRCDLEIRVLDATVPPNSAEWKRWVRWLDSQKKTARLLVCNKADLLTEQAIRGWSERALLVSGKSGLGLETLRRQVRASSPLANFSLTSLAPFTARQVRLMKQALSALLAEPPDSSRALAMIQVLTGK